MAAPIKCNHMEYSFSRLVRLSLTVVRNKFHREKGSRLY
jgi:hypothetical protein